MIDHISHSQVQMLLRCGIQYQFRYVDGLIIPPSASLVRGKCGHKSLETNFVQKIETKTDLPVEAVTDVFSDEWEKSKFEIAWTDKDLGGDSPAKASGKVKDSGIALVKVFHQEQSPQCQPVAVEEKFDIEFEGDYPKVTGIIDRIDEGDEIGEVKFVSKSPSADDIKKDIQLTIYDAGYRAKYGKPPKKLKKQWAVDTKTAKTVIQEDEPRSDETLTRLLWRFQSAMSAIKTGIFTPAPSDWWGCSPTWCGFWSRCKYHP